MNRFVLFIFFAMVAGCSIISLREERPSAPAVVRIDDYYKNNEPARQQLVEKAESLVGSRYRYGGYTPKGFDCSGFTSYLYQQIGQTISRSSSAQAQEGRDIPVAKAQPGDLVFFTGTGRGKISHVAMVVENQNDLIVIHSTTSSGVRKDNISQSAYWKPKLLYARKMLR